MLPAFPSHALPLRLRRFVDAEAEATQTPVDLPGMLVLGACAGAVARKVVVLVKRGYVEPLNLITTTALPPGTRKSAVFADVFRPFEEEERDLAEQARPVIAAATAARVALEECAKTARADLKKAETDIERADAQRRLEDALTELSTSPVP